TPPIELQITGIAGIPSHPLPTAVRSAPVVKCIEQLLATTLPLELGVNAQQRQQVIRARWQAGEYRIVVLKIASGTAEPGTQQHAQAPTPAFGDVQPSLRWGDQRRADKSLVDQQADGRQILG